MRRASSPYASSFSFGPGPLTPALKLLIFGNVAVFLLEKLVFNQFAIGDLPTPWFSTFLGLNPSSVVRRGYVWQLATYMFLHAGVAHLLFNLLAIWMFGGELERRWGTRYFLKFYFVTGIGAAALTVVAAYTLLPSLRHPSVVVVGASGAIYGLLLAYGLYFPDRHIYMYFVFPIPAKYFVMIMGALAFYSSMAESGGGVAHAAHLGGLVVGYLYLKSGRIYPWAEVKYRYAKWRINKVRKKFDVYQGGRANDWDRKVH
ncbi:MAG: rhomboid family intramembrane serine protease [Acidimicrobiia bacterium]|nr:rhomboid family intramembrane serine protease [Acidimicrobiia bacterium]